MKGVTGLVLAIIVGGVSITAMPEKAGSGLSPAGFRGRVVMQNRRFATTDMYLISTFAGGNEMEFFARVPPRAKVAVSGIEQYRNYSTGVDYDLDGIIDDSFDFFLFKSQTNVAYDI